MERGGWASSRNAFHLGVHAGVLLERLGLFGKKIFYVLPKVWKKAVLGDGNASKDDVVQWAEEQGVEVQTHDEAEAIAMGRYHAAERLNNDKK